MLWIAAPILLGHIAATPPAMTSAQPRIVLAQATGRGNGNGNGNVGNGNGNGNTGNNNGNNNTGNNNGNNNTGNNMGNSNSSNGNGNGTGAPGQNTQGANQPNPPPASTNLSIWPWGMGGTSSGNTQ